MEEIVGSGERMQNRGISEATCSSIIAEILEQHRQRKLSRAEANNSTNDISPVAATATPELSAAKKRRNADESDLNNLILQLFDGIESFQQLPKIRCIVCSNTPEAKLLPVVPRAWWNKLENEITLCCEELDSKFATLNALSHELLHAYDKNKFKYSSLECEERACAEVRACSIAECNYRHFFMESSLSHCVRDRATQSTMAGFEAQDSARCVKNVLERCIIRNPNDYQRLFGHFGIIPIAAAAAAQQTNNNNNNHGEDLVQPTTAAAAAAADAASTTTTANHAVHNR